MGLIAVHKGRLAPGVTFGAGMRRVAGAGRVDGDGWYCQQAVWTYAGLLAGGAAASQH